jgi:hypothetical protein
VLLHSTVQGYVAIFERMHAIFLIFLVTIFCACIEKKKLFK